MTQTPASVGVTVTQTPASVGVTVTQTPASVGVAVTQTPASDSRQTWPVTRTVDTAGVEYVTIMSHK